jgi:hypothetical protein
MVPFTTWAQLGVALIRNMPKKKKSECTTDRRVCISYLQVFEFCPDLCPAVEEQS